MNCLECANLDKTRYKADAPNGGVQKLYGCNARGGYVCGWVVSDNDLKWQGCSDFAEKKKPKQATLFDYAEGN
jgi:hypothetical protein